jgi:hypothetical protein
MRTVFTHRPATGVLVVALAAASTVAAVGQEEGFVGGAGQAGSFEAFDPVLTAPTTPSIAPTSR